MANRFDIAMGGISDTQERRQKFLVSNPVLQDGKVALTRCSDLKKYNTLDKINQSNVRVVENSGGSNLTFAKQYLKKSKIIIVTENKATIDYLLHNKADVMITDKIEAIYRQKTIPGLCVANPEKMFIISQKVYLIAKDNLDLERSVNLWLKQLEKNNQILFLKKQWIERSQPIIKNSFKSTDQTL